MPEPENLQQQNVADAYLVAVRQQIRWKKAQAPVLRELENHITDQKNAFLSQGLDEETATARAVAEMGDPVTAGQQLDRNHRPQPDWQLLVLTAVLLLLGLFFQFLMGPDLYDGREVFFRQLLWAGLSVLAMLAAYFLDFTIMAKYPKLFFGALSVLTAVYYLGAGHSYFRMGTIYLLMFFPTAFAGLVYGMRNQGYKGLMLCGAALLIPVWFAWLLPRITVLLLLGVSFLVILTAALVKGWFNVRKPIALFLIYITTITAVLAIPLGLIPAGVYAERSLEVILNPELIQVMINPALDPSGFGYMGTLLRQHLLHSRFIGQGLPLGDYSGALLPAANTDFVLTYLTYHCGWLVMLAVLALFFAFMVRAFLLCRRQKSVLGFLVSLAVILTLAVQCLTYILANFGILLFAPLSLPLLSYGGRGLLTNMFLIGFLLSVFRTGNLVKDETVPAAVKISRFIEYENGRVIINLKTHTS
ncbi:FtsW/RodA/SpoVE family cell cycle protein [Desulfosporosinus shakirovi]|uniref:FtsW/RodA/SpoVE family cell cycle protein n=1 Tax=Desulfosporosinus shakirovi TaxID=2885154 RepID=UPI001E4731AA|nr:FtsW/RodA/SpoVE family cell cycle protein [Desulfosporosinus sp. SRJS8]MCB8815393.1 FtsW/RodA/SpoVE family cell cycle protein [Desulfosporosinus sp. SRJS8]